MSPQPPNEDRLDRIERTLDRITERHEALAQSVELLLSTQNEHRREFEAHQKTMIGVAVDMRDVANRLAVIASAHQASRRAVTERPRSNAGAPKPN